MPDRRVLGGQHRPRVIAELGGGVRHSALLQSGEVAVALPARLAVVAVLPPLLREQTQRFRSREPHAAEWRERRDQIDGHADAELHEQLLGSRTVISPRTTHRGVADVHHRRESEPETRLAIEQPENSLQRAPASRGGSPLVAPEVPSDVHRLAAHRARVHLDDEIVTTRSQHITTGDEEVTHVATTVGRCDPHVDWNLPRLRRVSPEMRLSADRLASVGGRHHEIEPGGREVRRAKRSGAWLTSLTCATATMRDRSGSSRVGPRPRAPRASRRSC